MKKTLYFVLAFTFVCQAIGDEYQDKPELVASAICQRLANDANPDKPMQAEKDSNTCLVGLVPYLQPHYIPQPYTKQ